MSFHALKLSSLSVVVRIILIYVIANASLFDFALIIRKQRWNVIVPPQKLNYRWKCWGEESPLAIYIIHIKSFEAPRNLCLVSPSHCFPSPAWQRKTGAKCISKKALLCIETFKTRKDRTRAPEKLFRKEYLLHNVFYEPLTRNAPKRDFAFCDSGARERVRRGGKRKRE